jgi:hypothetical protein
MHVCTDSEQKKDPNDEKANQRGKLELRTGMSDSS